MIAVVCRTLGGLQEVAAVAMAEDTGGTSGLLVDVSLSYCCTSGPRSQEVGLLAVLPPMVLARVAELDAVAMHPTVTRGVQGGASGSVGGGFGGGCRCGVGAGGWGGAGEGRNCDQEFGVLFSEGRDGGHEFGIGVDKLRNGGLVGG